MLAGGAALALTGCSVGDAGDGRALRVLSFEGYTDPQWVRAFEQATGAAVRISYVYSVDEILAKMKAAGGRDYDVIIIESSSYRRLIEQRLIRPLDESVLGSVGALLPVFRDLSGLAAGGVRYGVPYAWGSIPLIYAKAAFHRPPESWSVLWDPQYRDRVISLDDANNNIVTAAIALGYPDPFRLNDVQFAAVQARLLDIKRNVATYYAGFDEGASIFAQGGIALMLAMAEPQVEMIRKRGVDVALTIPREGAIGWIDCWAISAGVRDVRLAHAWIDMMTRQDRGTYLSRRHRYGNVVDAAANRAIGLDYADRLKFLDAPEDFTRRANLWNAVKAMPV
jgi:spermidine/putrescine-binding protein